MSLKVDAPWITSKVRCQNGYVYIDQPYWNAKKRQAAHKRKYIGKYDGETFTPNKTYYALEAEYQRQSEPVKRGPGTGCRL